MEDLQKKESIYSERAFLNSGITVIRKNYRDLYKKVEVKNITQISEKIILQNYSPNCVIMTENGDIIYIHGRTGKYLELSHGEAKMNIYEMAREGLQEELPAIIRKVLAVKKSLTLEGIKVISNNSTQVINLTVKLIKEPAEMAGYLLLIFEDVKKVPAAKKIHRIQKSGKNINDLERD